MSSFTLTITHTIPNPLLSRQLIKVKLAHPNSSTPKKDEITKKLAYLFQTDPSLVIVRNCRTAFGLHETTAEAKIYEEISTLNSTEHSYVIARKTGVVADKVPRRLRKDTRKKKYKMFGSLRRNMRVAAKKEKRNK
ncbi:ribosomal protein S24 [Hamiltosporidium tvaerminnensis]|uniref:Ribosomal protein S24 n=3 Tax=Hamiltosporidium TaxID=1176354 RepID=A0A4Q9M1R3_9MICR|nr:ribosomal protein S24 [Hamiltosporidium magnivora]TBU10904.1 ribosomal protein S24 [Hamiltosporidium tvaerminnensis]TBU17653.1 ribosomal protein S24 [Hamiltosporidium tvaerminnensis]